jgi:hypothetical protein
MSKQTVPRIRNAELQSEAEGYRKVVIRYSDGSVLRGYLAAQEVDTIQKHDAESFTVTAVSGQVERVAAAAIKAIFFVKTFEGSPHYSEFKVFTHQPNGKGVWVRAHFTDGEIMEGVAPNSLETYAQPVFHLTPPDPGSNNQAVLVSKRYLQEMQILGLAAE